MDDLKHEADPVNDPDQAAERLEHPKVHREASDVRSGWIIAVASVVPVVTAIIFFVVWTFFKYIERQEQSIKFSNYPLAPVPSSALPKEPRLEPLNRIAGDTSANDFDRQLAQESQLTTFGSTSEKGFIHIPIQDAIKLVIPQLKVRA